MLSAADYLLLDAKPPRIASALPGGNGLSFDWRFSAGLTNASIHAVRGPRSRQRGQAIALTAARAVDVSSGVEIRPGKRIRRRIEAFIQAARAAFTVPAA